MASVGTEPRPGLLHREITEKVIGCAIEVHRELGPGLLESSYEHCLAYELGRAGLRFRAASVRTRREAHGTRRDGRHQSRCTTQA